MDFEDLFELAGFWLSVPAVLLIAALGWRFLVRRKCPKCATRGTLAYVYERNGRADKRFKHNPLICLHCKFQVMEDSADKRPCGT
jgi:hypothetical protein